MSARLIYVVGASGSGKDALIRYARGRLAGRGDVVFAHRYITRPADAGGENHVALSEAEFAARREARLFALHWHSHGHHYGVGIEINQWLARGISVVVNGSRDYLNEARARYSELLPVWIQVSPEVLGARLRARGRENEQEILQRLERHRRLQSAQSGGPSICNDGPLEAAGEALVDLILRHGGRRACA